MKALTVWRVGGGALTERRARPRSARARWRCVPTRPSGLTARLLELLLALPGAAGEAPRSSLGRLFGRGRGYRSRPPPPNWPHGILKQLYLHKVFL